MTASQTSSQSSRRAIVVTTINHPTRGMNDLAQGAAAKGWPLVVVGDLKSPPDFDLPGSDYYSIDRQVKAFPEFCSVLPTKHYTRKNVGYLLAMRQGATLVQETDDDNIPFEGGAFWEPVPERLEAQAVRPTDPKANGWLNVYALFSDDHIWPRGLPLEVVRHANAYKAEAVPASTRGLILQGLADENPDVDAVYRLVCKLPVSFRKRQPVLLRPGTWCPFNSQNTVFKKEVLPLLYLPSKCSFRMTDIWRSFVAQRCLWELGGEGVVFHAATVFQERNEHNLLRDFEDEVPGYLLNEKIRRALEPLKLDADVTRSLVRCYEAMVEQTLIPPDEMPILRGWCREVGRLLR